MKLFGIIFLCLVTHAASANAFQYDCRFAKGGKLIPMFTTDGFQFAVADGNTRATVMIVGKLVNAAIETPEIVVHGSSSEKVVDQRSNLVTLTDKSNGSALSIRCSR